MTPYRLEYFLSNLATDALIALTQNDWFFYHQSWRAIRTVGQTAALLDRPDIQDCTESMVKELQRMSLECSAARA